MLDWIKNLINGAKAPASTGPQATKAEPSRFDQTTLAEVVEKYDLVEVVPGTEEYGPFVICTPRDTGFDPYHLGDFNYKNSEDNSAGDGESYPPSVVTGAEFFSDSKLLLKEKKPNVNELGSSEPSPYTAFFRNEYNRDLQGLQGLRKYDVMRKSDGVVAGQLLAIKTPVMAGRWFIKPGKKDKKNERIADFVWSCLTEYMSISWTQVLEESMLSADFGIWVWQKVWEIRKIGGKEMVVLKKLAPRHPMDIKKINYDKHGGPESIVFFSKKNKDDAAVEEIKADIDDLLVISLHREAGNLLGVSILRPMYKHWYFKDQLYKIDAIQKERHGIGIPVIKLPPNFDPVKDVNEANQLGRNLRANERAHIVLPPNWVIEFAKLEGNPVDCIKSIQHHNDMIRESMLAAFTGSERVAKEEDLSLFLKATRFIAQSVCDAFNLYLIPDIVKYNFDGIIENPKLSVRQIGEQADMRTFSYALRNMIGAGVIRPDDVLEDYVRELMDLPEVDLTTVRVVKTPQSGVPQAGTTPNATPGTNTQLPNSQPSGQGNNKDGSGKENPATNTPGLPRQTPLPNIGVGGAGIGQGKGQA
ncbi:MAG TPA: hypothetical protein PKJ52_01385 [Rectinema sp.]|nr:hypothetical protein [Rectinema sp.]